METVPETPTNTTDQNSTGSLAQQQQPRFLPRENLHHLRDPNTAPARIYIGNVPEGATKADLEAKFSKYGQINGILMSKGFAFLQFMASDSAQDAIRHEHKSMLMDKCIAVRTAVKNPDGKPPQTTTPSSTTVGGVAAAQPVQTFPNQQQRPAGQMPPLAPAAPAFGGQMISSYGRSPDANDVEIIVLSKELTQYAEQIEGRLKRIGITCDLLYPNSEVPMGKVLASISGRGTLYAILVTMQNMQHQSITVNILYGTPAEHRNMPAEAALELVERDFKEYKAKEAAKQQQQQALPSAVPIVPVAAGLSVITPSLGERHPDAIQGLVMLLAQNQPLTVLQYDRILKYLTERREMQVKAELGEDPEAMKILSKPLSTIDPNAASLFKKDEPKLDPAELEVQKKIKEIMNKPFLINVTDNKTSPFKMTPELAELLQDGRVTRAIDSLLSKEVFATLGLKF